MQIYDILPDLTSARLLQGSSLSPVLSNDGPKLVIFWSVNCSSCGYLLKNLAAIPEIKSKRITPVLIHTYLDREQVSLADIKKKLDPLYFNAVCLDDKTDKLTSLFQFRYVPALYLFDKQERLRFKQIGKSSVSLIEQRLKRLMHTR
ncbi:TlpA family protein disulfide reductase [Oceanobacillus timonensis]|uniref:TlpA family protein disulfide reductase n=1 Tax=Oceanobacillus timonensis TaxID=1926285 RepID=UPI0009BB14AB|nr:thioredoxin fold domain-containing protein [Oceanobacillus timonensis]